MKKLIVLFIAVLFAAVVLAGCTPATTDNDNDAPADSRLRVITTVFPQYDFIREIAGDRVAVSMLISPGAEPHSFDPAPRDIIALNEADLFVYVGGHSEGWVEDILASLDTAPRTVALLDLVELVYSDHDHHHDHNDHHHHHDHNDDHHHDHNDDHHHGHDDHHHHDHNDDHHHDHNDDDHHHHDDHNDHHHDHNDGHHHHHDHEYDEHVWTSPQNAIAIVQALTDVLAELDPGNADYFRANAAAYVAELEALDQAFTEVVEQGVRDTVIFADRFPFRYLMDAYGLHAYAAFPGCSADTQASPATIAALIDKVNAEDIPVVFTIEFSSGTIADVVVEDTGARVLELHSAHNVSAEDYAAGVTYLEIMLRNVEQLREALS